MMCHFGTFNTIFKLFSFIISFWPFGSIILNAGSKAEPFCPEWTCSHALYMSEWSLQQCVLSFILIILTLSSS